MLCATFGNILFRICNQSLLLTSFIFNLESSSPSNVAGPPRYISVFAEFFAVCTSYIVAYRFVGAIYAGRVTVQWVGS